MSEPNIWIKMYDLEAGAELRLSNDDANEVLYWRLPGGWQPRNIEGVCFHYQCRIERRDGDNAWYVIKNDTVDRNRIYG